jgi:hypothetical protein
MNLDWSGAACPPGWYQTVWNASGPAGPAGPAGPQGPSGVVSSNSSDLLVGAPAVPADIVLGGSFVTYSHPLDTVKLTAGGTYLVTFNAKATPNEASTGQVFPQFFVYNQARNSAFAGDLFNIGTGALEPFSGNVGTSHDSYYSGTDQITVPAGGETLYVYAFGYVSDGSSGSYNLDSASLVATQLRTR